MSKFGKFKEIIAAAAPIAKPFVPGAAGSVLDIVTKTIAEHQSPPSGASAEAFAKLSAIVDEQTAAILALHERVKVLEAK